MERDAGEAFGKSSGVKISDHLESILQGADVLVDFTRPEASMQYRPPVKKLG